MVITHWPGAFLHGNGFTLFALSSHFPYLCHCLFFFPIPRLTQNGSQSRKRSIQLRLSAILIQASLIRRSDGPKFANVLRTLKVGFSCKTNRLSSREQLLSVRPDSTCSLMSFPTIRLSNCLSSSLGLASRPRKAYCSIS